MTFARFSRQRGAISIFFAFGIVLLIGCAGLAIDTGRMLVVRSELQTAMDSCALAGALELNALPDAARRAASAGRFVGGLRNKAEFQSAVVTILDDDVTFPVTLADPAPPTAATANGSASRIVRCKVTSPGVAPLLLSVLGVGSISMTVSATATVQSAQSVCAIPMALMGDANLGMNFGYSPGQKISLQASGGLPSFRWANVSGDPALSGNNALAATFLKYGSCEVSTQVDRCISASSGEVNNLDQYWNSRFGVYRINGLSASEAIPDFSGYGFKGRTDPVLEEYRTIRAPQREQAQNSVIPPGYSVPNNVNASFGASGRRLTVMPVINAGDQSCGGVNTSKRLIGWACILMLSPIRSEETAEVEYIGPANAADTPCRTAGIPGSFGGGGPLVPVLIQ